MLTREQARTKECPYRIGAHLADGEILPQEWFLCTANDCPKWVDDEIKVYAEEGARTREMTHRCDHVRYAGDARACMDGKQILCSDCNHRYGRCGA